MRQIKTFHKKTTSTHHTTSLIKRIIIGFLAGVILLIGAWYSFEWLNTYNQKAHVEQLAKRLERYQEQHGYLPNPDDIQTMQALGFELRTGWYPDFIPITETQFELWLYNGFDGPHMVYHSTSKEWREKY